MLLLIVSVLLVHVAVHGRVAAARGSWGGFHPMATRQLGPAATWCKTAPVCAAVALSAAGMLLLKVLLLTAFVLPVAGVVHSKGLGSMWPVAGAPCFDCTIAWFSSHVARICPVCAAVAPSR